MVTVEIELKINPFKNPLMYKYSKASRRQKHKGFNHLFENRRENAQPAGQSLKPEKINHFKTPLLHIYFGLFWSQEHACRVHFVENRLDTS